MNEQELKKKYDQVAAEINKIYYLNLPGTLANLKEVLSVEEYAEVNDHEYINNEPSEAFGIAIAILLQNNIHISTELYTQLRIMVVILNIEEELSRFEKENSKTFESLTESK